jgi:hypothetical protein
MDYSEAFRYCTHCQKATVHARREVVRGGERHEEHQCTQCDTKTSRVIGRRPESRA